VKARRERINLAAGWAEFDRGSEVQVGDRAIPQRIDVTMPSTPDGWPSLHLTIEVRKGAPQCTELTIRAHPEGREVRGVDIRAVRLEAWVDEIAAVASMDVVTLDDGSTVFSKSINRAMAGAAPGEVVNTTPGAAIAELRRYLADEGGEDEIRQAKKGIQHARSAARRTVTDELLRQVAEVYRANLKDRPGEAVRAAFWVHPRTAARYIRAARDKGFLPDTTRGKVTG